MPILTLPDTPDEIPDLLTGAPLAGYDPEDVREAGAQIRTYCGWHIAPVITETATLRVERGRGTIILPTLMLNSIVSITMDGTLLTANDFDAYLGRTARIDLGRIVFPQRVVIVFQHGYTEAPADVVKVVKSLARGGATGSSVKVGNIQISASTGSTAVGLSSLRYYQLPAVA